MITAPRLRLLIMVLHAPSLSNHSVGDVRKFWTERSQELVKRPEGSEYLLLADTNARTGTVCSDHIGDHDAEEESLAGSLLHDFLVSVEGFLPSTFGGFHTGPSGTWRVPDGPWHRIDYIVLPATWQSFGLTSAVLCDF